MVDYGYVVQLVYNPKGVLRGAAVTVQEKHLAEVILRLSTREFPDALCDFIGQFITFDNAVIIAYFAESAPVLLHCQGNMHNFLPNLERYVLGTYELDPFYQLHTNRASAGLYRLLDVAPDHFQRSRYFIEYYKSTGLQDELAFVSRPSASTSVHVCLGKVNQLARKFDARAIAAGQKMVPVVSALVAQQWAQIRPSGKNDDRDIYMRLQRAIVGRHGIHLTHRQTEICILVLRGHSSISISQVLKISPETVKVFRKQLHKKCNVDSQAQLFSLLMPLLLVG